MWSTALLLFSICPMVLPSQDLMSDLTALDSAITAVLDQLPDQVTTARLNIAANTARANRFSLSYGIAVALGTLMTIDVGLTGTDPSSLTPQDWFLHAGTALYGYGFGAPYLLGGALEESDPGCGAQDLHEVLLNYPNLSQLASTVYADLEYSDATSDPYFLVEPRHLPAVKMFDLKSMIVDLRQGLGCLLEDSSVSNSITRLEELISERLSQTQRLIDNYEQTFYYNNGPRDGYTTLV